MEGSPDGKRNVSFYSNVKEFFQGRKSYSFLSQENTALGLRGGFVGKVRICS